MTDNTTTPGSAQPQADLAQALVDFKAQADKVLEDVSKQKMTKLDHYKQLMQLELETTKMRHTTFTALMSISFVLPGLALKAEAQVEVIPFFGVKMDQLVFLLGFIFYCFSVFHYWWYHRYSHIYRRELKKLEGELGIKVYGHRVRPVRSRFKMHFEWSLYIIAVLYGGVVCCFVGYQLFGLTVGSIVVSYLVLMYTTRNEELEPREVEHNAKGGHATKRRSTHTPDDHVPE